MEGRAITAIRKFSGRCSSSGALISYRKRALREESAIERSPPGRWRRDYGGEQASRKAGNVDGDGDDDGDGTRGGRNEGEKREKSS